MQLTERHMIKKGSPYYERCDELSFLSKNLYNETLYLVRQRFFETGEFVRYATLNHELSEQRQVDYKSLPAKVAQQTMRGVDTAFMSFFKALKSYRKDPSKFTAKPEMPKYLDKKDGRYVVTYTSQAVSRKALEDNGYVIPSGSGIAVKSRVRYKDLDCVRIVRGTECYFVEVVYTVGGKPLMADNGRHAAMDLGVSNLATVVSNCDDVLPYIISGKELKSYNHWYNRRSSDLKSMAEARNGRKSTRRIRMMARDRQRRIDDFLHKASRHVVNRLVSDRMTALVIGYNKGWKQDTDMGKANNQNFTEIPFLRFVQMVEYKCRLAGIACHLQNESHTSKCSFLDNEEVCHHERYKGTRVKRGLFKASDGRTMNADVNGAMNILRKCKPLGNVKTPIWCNGCVVHPVIIHLWTMTKRSGAKRTLNSGLRMRKLKRRTYLKQTDLQGFSMF